MKNTPDSPVRLAILDALAEAGVEYQCLEHPPARTAAEAAELRNTPLRMGIKSMVMKYDQEFAVFSLRADREVRSRLIRMNLHVQRTRFASQAELLALTGLQPGAVPPFGHPILPLRLFADPSIFEQELIVFTAGVKDFSISMASRDWQLVAHPELVPFSRSSSPAL